MDVLRKQLVKLGKQQREQCQHEAKETASSIVEKRPKQTVDEQDPGRLNVEQKATSRLSECDRVSTVSDAEVPVVIRTMAKGSKLEFILGQDWEMYIERLELYFIANDIADEKKAVVLLTKISADTYSLVRDLCAPTKPKDKSFAQLVDIVSEHFRPKLSETMERCKFHSAKQNETETVADFGVRLKKLALNCNFTDLQTALRDQFVCGLKDQETKTELFQVSQLSYNKAYKLAAARDEAERNATNMERVT